MTTRIDVQNMLEELIGSRNVYFQPPSSMRIDYPCIVYSIKSVDNKYANNDIYKQDHFYELILVDSNPDSEYFSKLCMNPNCRFRNAYVSDNLNHFVFNFYAY